MFKFMPFGGVGYIGGNISYMEIAGFSFLIDSGILFPKEDSLGIDHLYPNIDLLDSDLFITPKYLLLTHAHEDHLGGLKYLLKKLPSIKVVCSSYTKSFILKKFPTLKVALVSLDEFVNTSSLPKFEFFNIRHSIPGVYGFFCVDRSAKHAVLFCTDFRFNINEPDSSYLSTRLIESFSAQAENRSVFIDSTNIASDTKSAHYEEDLYKSLKSEIAYSKGDTYITFFPSNIERLGNIIKICNQLERPCCLAGYSVQFNYSLGLENELLPPIKESLYNEGSSVILLSGSQGDLRGAFRRVFTQSDKQFRPKPNDQLLFSSKIIPGNEISVNDIFNKVSELGIKINKGKSPIIHASGHAYSDEIQSIVKSFKAQQVIPIHLESSFFQDFEEKIVISKNSTIYKLLNYSMLSSKNAKTFTVREYDKPDLHIYSDGGEVVDKSVINNRRRLGNLGSIFISIKKDHNDMILINHYGVPEFNSKSLKSEVSKAVVQFWGRKDLQEEVRISVRHYLSKTIGYKPLVFVHFL